MNYSLSKEVKFKRLQKTKYKQGFFNPNHPDKYMGDLRHIIYRSEWELKMMNKFDNNPAVIKWSSEETIIPYKSPVDGRTHRYFVDFKAVMKTKDGLKTFLFEVKPKRQTQPPKKPQKPGKRYVKEVMTYAVNQAKFNAAKKYCEDRGFEFHILTEEEIFD